MEYTKSESNPPLGIRSMILFEAYEEQFLFVYCLVQF